MGPTATAMVGFGVWFVLLTFALAFLRVYISLSSGKSLNSFSPDGSDTPGLGQRLTRARDNCYENAGVVAAIAGGAFVAGRLDVTDPLAMYLLYARIGQSLTHIASVSVPAVLVRATFYTVQLIILLIWALNLL